MVFSRYVEIGRVCMINYGADYGKLCVILNVINGSYALVTGPRSKTGITRRKINMKRLTVTEIKIDILLNNRDKFVEKAWEEADVDTKWMATDLFKKIDQRARRTSMNDFERFKVKLAQRERSKLIRQELKALKASA